MMSMMSANFLSADIVFIITDGMGSPVQAALVFCDAVAPVTAGSSFRTFLSADLGRFYPKRTSDVVVPIENSILKATLKNIEK
jgi:hypothetical protein